VAEEQSKAVAVAAQRAQIVVEDPIPIFDTAQFEMMARIAKAMAGAGLLPEHVRGKSFEEAQANCFLIVNMAKQWNVDPFQLAQGSYFLHGKLGFEGKLIQARLERVLGSPFDFEYEGEGDSRKITVTNRRRLDGAMKSISGTVKMWKTFEKAKGNEQPQVKGNWKNDPDKQLRYRGVVEWGRAWETATITGLLTDDEVSNFEERYDERQRGRHFVEIPSARSPEVPTAVEPTTIEGRVQEERRPSDIRQTGAPYGGVDRPNDDPPEQVRAREESDRRREAEAGANALAGDRRMEAQAQERSEPGSSVAPTGAAATTFADEPEGEETDAGLDPGIDWEANLVDFRDQLPQADTDEKLNDLYALHDIDGMPREFKQRLEAFFEERAADLLATKRVEQERAEAEAKAKAKAAAEKPKEEPKPAAEPDITGTTWALVRAQLRAAETVKAVQTLFATRVEGAKEKPPADVFAYLSAIRDARLEKLGVAPPPPMESEDQLRHRVLNVKLEGDKTPAKAMTRLFATYVDPFVARLPGPFLDELRGMAEGRIKDLAKERRAARKAAQGG
jgi:hypothetical protein